MLINERLLTKVTFAMLLRNDNRRLDVRKESTLLRNKKHSWGTKFKSQSELWCLSVLQGSHHFVLGVDVLAEVARLGQSTGHAADGGRGRLARACRLRPRRNLQPVCFTCSKWAIMQGQTSVYLLSTLFFLQASRTYYWTLICTRAYNMNAQRNL